MQELQGVLEKYNIVYCENPVFLWDFKKKAIVTEEENNSDVFHQQMGVYAFNTVKELEGLLGEEGTVVIQKDSLQPSPWQFCKYKIRFKIIRDR